MIFEDIYKDNRIQLNSFIENAIDYDNRFMLFVSIYDESTDTIIITDDIIFNEAGSKNILSKDIGLNTKNNEAYLLHIAVMHLIAVE